MYEFILGDIFWLEVGFVDIPNESKIRPALKYQFLIGAKLGY